VTVIPDVAQARRLNLARVKFARFGENQTETPGVTGDQPAVLGHGPVNEAPLQDVLRRLQAGAWETVNVRVPVPDVFRQPVGGALVFADVHVLVAGVGQVAADHGNGMGLESFQAADEVHDLVHMVLVLGTEDRVESQFEVCVALPQPAKAPVGFQGLVEAARRFPQAVMEIAQAVHGNLDDHGAVRAVAQNPFRRPIDRFRQ